MKIKKTIGYLTREYYLRAVVIYYCIMVGLAVFFTLITLIQTGSVMNTGHSTIDISSMIFLFVLGLNVFKAPFGLFQQNGISRKTHWMAVAILIGCVSAIMVGIDLLLTFIPWGMRYSTMYETIYSIFASGDMAKFSITSLLWSFTGYYAFSALGFFLSTLYYRMNKMMKLIVSVGVPGFIFIVLPLLQVVIPSFNGFMSFIRGFGWAFGWNGIMVPMSPMRAVGTFGVTSVVSMALAFLLMRRATMRSE